MAWHRSEYSDATTLAIVTVSKLDNRRNYTYLSKVAYNIRF
jgi:hypothetical protein